MHVLISSQKLGLYVRIQKSFRPCWWHHTKFAVGWHHREYHTHAPVRHSTWVSRARLHCGASHFTAKYIYLFWSFQFMCYNLIYFPPAIRINRIVSFVCDLSVLCWVPNLFSPCEKGHHIVFILLPFRDHLTPLPGFVTTWLSNCHCVSF